MVTSPVGIARTVSAGDFFKNIFQGTPINGVSHGLTSEGVPPDQGDAASVLLEN